jgi:two-component system sensor histidine kinase/response regulator
MSAEALEKLFRIDANFSTEGTQGETGTGLGLILCKEFITKTEGIYRLKAIPVRETGFHSPCLQINKRF